MSKKSEGGRRGEREGSEKHEWYKFMRNRQGQLRRRSSFTTFQTRHLEGSSLEACSRRKAHLEPGGRREWWWTREKKTSGASRGRAAEKISRTGASERPDGPSVRVMVAELRGRTASDAV